MKKMIGQTKELIRQYWRKVMESTRRRMSVGAQYIDKIIPWARKENWRGRREKKK